MPKAVSYPLKTVTDWDGGAEVRVSPAGFASPRCRWLSLSLWCKMAAVLAMCPVTHPSEMNRVELMSHTWVPVIWKQVLPLPVFHLSTLLALCLSQSPRGLGCHGQDTCTPLINWWMSQTACMCECMCICVYCTFFCVRAIPERRQLFLSDWDFIQIWFDGKEKQSEVNVIYRRKMVKWRSTVE